VIGSIITGSGIGGDLDSVRLESATINCDGQLEDSCVSGRSLELAVNMKGETSARRFFNATNITFKSNPVVALRYLRDSDEEGLRNFPCVHFRKISRPFSGRYAVSPRNSRHFVAEMSGDEKGLLLSTGGSITGMEMWRLPQNILGMIQTNESCDIDVREAETLVDDPVFIWATMRFTSSFTPYKHRRTLIKARSFLYLLGAVRL
jgi:hypothetical protein